jgi:hypothetical protein
MARTFSNAKQQRLYEMRLADPASTRLNGLGAAYHTGFDYPDKPSRFVKNSLAYAAWAAGVDTARRTRNT